MRPLDDEKEGLRSPSPTYELEEGCCRGRRRHEGKGIRRLIRALAIFGVIFVGYKALVQCVKIRYRLGQYELSEVCLLSYHLFC